MKKFIILFYIFHFSFFTIHLSVAQVIQIPAAYPTIQQGIDVANQGDTVLVSPGNYIENINYNGKNIIVASLFLTTHDPAYILQTIIDGNQAGSVVTFENKEDSKALLSGFTLINGGNFWHGGIYCENSSPTLEDLRIVGNVSDGFWGVPGKGGGIFFKSSSPVLKNVIIHGNSATGAGSNNHWNASQGGGIYFDTSNGVLENVVISDNRSDQGGGIACINSSVYLKNTTISGNHYLDEIVNDCLPPIYECRKGGGIYCDASSTVIFDSISRGNIYNNSAWYGNDIYSDAIMHLFADTFSVQDPYWYHTEPFENFSFDIRQGYHKQAAMDLYVSPNGNDRNSGLSPNEPVRTIHYAYSIILADNLSPQTIHLLEGTYSPSTNGEQFPVRVFDYISLAGVSDTEVILDAEEMTRVMEIGGNTTSHVSGMTLTGGYVFGMDGGGVYCANSSPVITDVIINNNSAHRFYTGYAGNYGGYGGGLYIVNSVPVLNNLRMTGNLATGFGGGIYCSYSEITMKQAELDDNLAYSSFHNSYAGIGGGIYCSGSDLNLQQVTMIHNLASFTGGGIYYSDTSNINLINTIMWHDSLTELVNGNPQDGINVLTVSYCNIEGGQDSVQSDPGTVHWLEGNISQDPLFVGSGTHPFMLTPDSPCRNAGSPDTTGLFLPLTDLAGGPRVWEDRIDIGAYEWSNVGVPLVCSSQFAVHSYPNPTGGIVNCQFLIMNCQGLSLRLYDCQGREVAVLFEGNLPAGEHTVRFDSSGFPAGIYVVRLETEDAFASTKMVVMK